MQNEHTESIIEHLHAIRAEIVGARDDICAVKLLLSSIEIELDDSIDRISSNVFCGSDSIA